MKNKYKILKFDCLYIYIINMKSFLSKKKYTCLLCRIIPQTNDMQPHLNQTGNL